MNRERLTILRDHLASLPDERFDISIVKEERDCGTVACIKGWAETIFAADSHGWERSENGDTRLMGLGLSQHRALFTPDGWNCGVDRTRSDAIAAIQSMLDSPDDDALPVWPERAEPSQ